MDAKRISGAWAWAKTIAITLTIALYGVCRADPIPTPQYLPNELLYMPILSSEIDTYWKDHPAKSIFAAQVRQETCAGLKSKFCWSPYAELKTSREYGFGLGQITITSQFNNFTEATKMDKSMKDWTWENRYNAAYQLRTLVLTVRNAYSKFDWASDPDERLAFAIASYNGGIGGVLSDRTVCGVTPLCDKYVWFGNVEHTSKKAKVPISGYGKSFFQVNREYVRHIVCEYPARYTSFFNEPHRVIMRCITN